MDIDLGRKSPGGIEPSSPKKDEKEHVYYPTVYIDNVDGVEELPDEGTVTFRYKKVRESTETRDGETNHSVSLDLHCITDYTGEASKSDDEDPGDRLDRLAKEVSEEED